MTDQEFKTAVMERFDGMDQRLDELTAETSLMRAALERFGFMGKAPTPPPTTRGESRPPMAAKGKGQ